MRSMESTLNPKMGYPAYSTKAKKEPRYLLAVKSNRVSFCQREMARNSERLLKGKHIKFPL